MFGPGLVWILLVLEFGVLGYRDLADPWFRVFLQFGIVSCFGIGCSAYERLIRDLFWVVWESSECKGLLRGWRLGVCECGAWVWGSGLVYGGNKERSRSGLKVQTFSFRGLGFKF